MIFAVPEPTPPPVVVEPARAPAVSIGRIEAIVEKPRTFYLLGESMWAYSLGAPVFSLDGKLVGILFLRTAKSQADPMSGFMFSNLNQMGMMPAILPTVFEPRRARKRMRSENSQKGCL